MDCIFGFIIRGFVSQVGTASRCHAQTLQKSSRTRQMFFSLSGFATRRNVRLGSSSTTPQLSANMEPTPSPAAPVCIWELLALAAILSALTRTVYLSMGMKLKARSRCFSEGFFMVGLVAVWLASLVRSRDVNPGVLVLRCSPLAVGRILWQCSEYACDMRRSTLSRLALVFDGVA